METEDVIICLRCGYQNYESEFDMRLCPMCNSKELHVLDRDD